MNVKPLVGIGSVLVVGTFQATVVEIMATAEVDRLGKRTIYPWVVVENNGHRETLSGKKIESYL